MTKQSNQPTDAELLLALARVKVIFQQRAVAAIMGIVPKPITKESHHDR